MHKIVVTGGIGFIGSNLTEELMKQGHQVTVLENFATGKIQNLLPLLSAYPDSLTLQVDDIHNMEDCKKAQKGSISCSTRWSLPIFNIANMNVELHNHFS